ncbi:hypothetical protein [Pseudomonas migulae]|uniref:Uncharacterized protein n=1 Tax=Pseudomonas migulae TaxID=78543 RepID=A0ABY8MKG2_9PSED|nr:hypothetical protein [Pseudomonas migulae]WGK87834.1 hypothetical protein MOQ58_14880 [Pseudomonas migulae]
MSGEKPKRTPIPCGSETGLPAMDFNDNACCLNERGVQTSIAGKPVSFPQGSGVRFLNQRGGLASIASKRAQVLRYLFSPEIP